MFKKIISSYKHSLFEVDSKNLTTGSQLSLFFFIIIVFIIIFSGIEMQQSYVKSPSAEFGHSCTSNIQKNRGVNEFQNRNVTNDIYSVDFRYKYWTLQDFKYNHHRKSEYQILKQYGSDALCKKIGTTYLEVANDTLYRDRLLTYDALTKSLEKTNTSISTKEDEYSSMLLEDIAKQTSEYSILSSSSEKVKVELSALRKQVKQLNVHLAKADDLSTLKSFVTFKTLLDTSTKDIDTRYTQAKRYYKFQYTLNIFLFLLPTWLLFYIAYRVFKKKERHILAHLSVHVANVTAIYIGFYLLSLIYDVIPKVFMKKLIEFFTHYNMTIVLNIFAIIIFMAIFGLFIYRIQRNKSKEFSQMSEVRQARIKRERIHRGDCSECGKKPNHSDTFCGGCGHQLLKECLTCKALTNVNDTHCRSCGKEV